MKATILNLVKELCGMNDPYDAQHKETTHNRINRDKSAVQKNWTLIFDQMINLFVINDGANPENRQPLVNITTSIATPDNVAILCQAIKRMVQKK